MIISCIFGHKWASCKCSACGKTRDEAHDWSKDCEKCAVCGKTRSQAHDWSTDCEKCSRCGTSRASAHTWAGCRCSACGKAREQGHDWSTDCEKCSRCGATRQNAHQWSGCKCSACGKTRDEEHDWSQDCEKCAICGATLCRAALDKFKLRDAALLGRIAQQHPSWEIRAAASKRLPDFLSAAIMLGDSAAAISLLEIPGDHFLVGDEKGWTPLHCAAFKGDREILELLLKKGADPNTRDGTNKWTPLHFAAAHGHCHLVAPLINAGADPNAVSGPDRNTPLHIAVAFGCPPGYYSSLTRKEDVFAKEKQAMSKGDLRRILQSHPEVVSELLKHGANPAALTRQGRTPLHLAAEDGDIACAEVLVAGGADLNGKGAQDATPLHWAAAKGNSEFGKWLVKKGAHPDLADALGWTPLFLAGEDGATDLVPILLAAGARTQATINGKTVTFRGTSGAAKHGDADNDLIEAAESGDLDAAKSAIDAGAEVNCKSGDGWTPLLSASKDHSEIVQLLLASGGDPNIPSGRGYTPLMRAAGNGAEEIVRLLLAAGADKKMVDCNGKTAYRLAMEMLQVRCAQMVQ